MFKVGGRNILSFRKGYLIPIVFLLIICFIVYAQEEAFTPSISDGEEVENLGYKFSKHSNVITTTQPEIYCSWKTDLEDDDWKTCTAIFEVENQGTGSTISFPIINFNFENNNIRNQVIQYSDTFSLEKKTYTEQVVEHVGEFVDIDYIEKTFTKKEFTSFKNLPNQLDTSKPFAIKITYEAPKHSFNQFNFSISGEGFSTSIDPDQSACGDLSEGGVYILTQNITTGGTCFTISASDVILDGNGYAIIGNGSGSGVKIDGNYQNFSIKDLRVDSFQDGIIAMGSTDNSFILNNTIINISYGSVTLSGAENVIIRDNTIKDGNSQSIDIYNTDTHSLNITDNIISHGGTLAIKFDTGAGNNSIISSNSIYSNGAGILLEGIEGVTIKNNNIFDNKGNGYHSNEGIAVVDSIKVTIKDNILYNNVEWAVKLLSSSNNVIYNNTIYDQDDKAVLLNSSSGNNLNSNLINATIQISSLSENNLFLNNNISSDTKYNIKDDTGDNYANYLIYNNSFGEIEWTNESNGGFLRNLTIDGNIGLGMNLFIGNNTAALDKSSFSLGKINSNAKITLNSLSFSLVDSIFKFDNFSTSSYEIITKGTDCIGSGCTISSYNNGTGTLIFNSTNLGSFSAYEGDRFFVNLEDPDDNFNSPDGYVFFECSAISDNNDLVNISLYTNATGTWALNQTKTVTGNYNSTIFNLTALPDDGSYKWNCLAFNNKSESIFADNNRTFSVNIKVELEIQVPEYIRAPVNTSRWILTSYSSYLNESLTLGNLTIYESDNDTYFQKNVSNSSSAQTTIYDEEGKPEKILTVRGEKVRMKPMDFFDGNFSVENEENLNFTLEYFYQGQSYLIYDNVTVKILPPIVLIAPPSIPGVNHTMLKINETKSHGGSSA